MTFAVFFISSIDGGGRWCVNLVLSQQTPTKTRATQTKGEKQQQLRKKISLWKRVILRKQRQDIKNTFSFGAYLKVLTRHSAKGSLKTATKQMTRMRRWKNKNNNKYENIHNIKQYSIMFVMSVIDYRNLWKSLKRLSLVISWVEGVGMRQGGGGEKGGWVFLRCLDCRM